MNPPNRPPPPLNVSASASAPVPYLPRAPGPSVLCSSLTPSQAKPNPPSIPNVRNGSNGAGSKGQLSNAKASTIPTSALNHRSASPAQLTLNRSPIPNANTGSKQAGSIGQPPKISAIPTAAIIPRPIPPLKSTTTSTSSVSASPRPNGVQASTPALTLNQNLNSIPKPSSRPAQPRASGSGSGSGLDLDSASRQSIRNVPDFEITGYSSARTKIASPTTASTSKSTSTSSIPSIPASAPASNSNLNNSRLNSRPLSMSTSVSASRLQTSLTPPPGKNASPPVKSSNTRPQSTSASASSSQSALPSLPRKNTTPPVQKLNSRPPSTSAGMSNSNPRKLPLPENDATPPVRGSNPRPPSNNPSRSDSTNNVMKGSSSSSISISHPAGTNATPSVRVSNPQPPSNNPSRSGNMNNVMKNVPLPSPSISNTITTNAGSTNNNKNINARASASASSSTGHGAAEKSPGAMRANGIGKAPARSSGNGIGSGSGSGSASNSRSSQMAGLGSPSGTRKGKASAHEKSTSSRPIAAASTGSGSGSGGGGFARVKGPVKMGNIGVIKVPHAARKTTSTGVFMSSPSPVASTSTSASATGRSLVPAPAPAPVLARTPASALPTASTSSLIAPSISTPIPASTTNSASIPQSAFAEARSANGEVTTDPVMIASELPPLETLRVEVRPETALSAQAKSSRPMTSTAPVTKTAISSTTHGQTGAGPNTTERPTSSQSRQDYAISTSKTSTSTSADRPARSLSSQSVANGAESQVMDIARSLPSPPLTPEGHTTLSSSPAQATNRKRAAPDENSPLSAKRQRLTSQNDKASKTHPLEPVASRIKAEVIDLTGLDDADPFIPGLDFPLKQERVEPAESIPLITPLELPHEPNHILHEPFETPEEPEPAIWETAAEKVRGSRSLRPLIGDDENYVGSEIWAERRREKRVRDQASRPLAYESEPPLRNGRCPYLRRNLKAGVTGRTGEIFDEETTVLKSTIPDATPIVSSKGQFDEFYRDWEVRDENIYTSRIDRFLTIEPYRIIAVDQVTHERVSTNNTGAPDEVRLQIYSDEAPSSPLQVATLPIYNHEFSPRLGRMFFLLQRKVIKETRRLPRFEVHMTFFLNGKRLSDSPYVSHALEPLHPDGTYASDINLRQIDFPIPGHPYNLRLEGALKWCTDPLRPPDRLAPRIIKEPIGTTEPIIIRYEGLVEIEVEGWNCAWCKREEDAKHIEDREKPIPFRSDAELAVHHAILHGEESRIGETEPRKSVDGTIIVKLVLQAGAAWDRPSRVIPAVALDQDMDPFTDPFQDYGVSHAPYGLGARPRYTPSGLPEPFMRKRVNQWTEWSHRVEPDTVADLMPALDDIWDGGNYRHMLLAHEETIIWTRHHLSPQHRFMSCCWNRWVDQQGPIPAIGRGSYLSTFIRTYGPILDRAGVASELGETLHGFFRDRYFSVKEYLDAMKLWRDTSGAQARAVRQRQESEERRYRSRSSIMASAGASASANAGVAGAAGGVDHGAGGRTENGLPIEVDDVDDVGGDRNDTRHAPSASASMSMGAVAVT